MLYLPKIKLTTDDTKVCVRRDIVSKRVDTPSEGPYLPGLLMRSEICGPLPPMTHGGVAVM